MEKYIKECLKEANISYQQGDVPIGAILIDPNGNIIAKAHNTREKDHNILGHAEINAILKAAKKLNSWNLSKYRLLVSLKPCSMCSEVIKQSRIDKVFYLVDKLDYKKEYSRTSFEKLDDDFILDYEQKYIELLQLFFKQKR